MLKKLGNIYPALSLPDKCLALPGMMSVNKCPENSFLQNINRFPDSANICPFGTTDLRPVLYQTII